MAGGERAGVPSRLGAVFPHFCPIRPSVGVASDPRAVPDFASHHSATSPRVFVCVFDFWSGDVGCVLVWLPSGSGLSLGRPLAGLASGRRGLSPSPLSLHPELTAARRSGGRPVTGRHRLNRQLLGTASHRPASAACPGAGAASRRVRGTARGQVARCGQGSVLSGRRSAGPAAVELPGRADRLSDRRDGADSRPIIVLLAHNRLSIHHQHEQTAPVTSQSLPIAGLPTARQRTHCRN